MEHELRGESPSPESVTKKARESAKCLFCGVQTRIGGDSRARHLGRHMEEISFALIGTPYKEWDFYSDRSISSIVRNIIREPDGQGLNKLYLDSLDIDLDTGKKWRSERAGYDKQKIDAKESFLLEKAQRLFGRKLPFHS